MTHVEPAEYDTAWAHAEVLRTELEAARDLVARITRHPVLKALLLRRRAERDEFLGARDHVGRAQLLYLEWQPTLLALGPDFAPKATRRESLFHELYFETLLVNLDAERDPKTIAAWLDRGLGELESTQKAINAAKAARRTA